MKKYNALDWLSIIVLAVGGINWGLVGLFSFDLVAAIFGEMSVFSRIVYSLVGISAVYTLVRAYSFSSSEKGYNSHASNKA